MITPILILAAGASRRMGQDKLLLPVGRRPLLRHVAQTALATGQPTFVALPPHNPARLQALAGLAVTQVLVPGAAQGMALSLRAGVTALPACARFMVMLADMPDLTPDDLAQLIAAAAGPVTRATDADGRPGHPVIFDAALRPAFASLTGDQGARDLIQRHSCTDVALGDAATTDLDTPQDWARWQAAAD